MRDSLLADDIKFACSQCGQRMVVERSGAGLTADCPVCLNPVIVPQVSTAEESSNGAVAPGEAASPVRARHEPEQDTVRQLEAELNQAREEVARQRALFTKAVDECERLKASSTHVHAELKTFQSDRQALKADAAQARQVVLTAEGRIAELEEALVAFQQENAALREQIETDVAALNAQLAAREHELQERTGELSQVVRNYARVKSELSASIIEATGLRTELNVCQKDFRTAAEQLAVAQPQLGEAQTLLESVTVAHREAAEQRDHWRQRAEGFENDLASIDSGRDLLELRAQHQKLQEAHRGLETTLAERTEEASKNNDALRGIINRQNTTLGVYHSEVRRLRRARFALRLVYGIFAVGLIALGFVAFKVFSPAQFAHFLRH